MVSLAPTLTYAPLLDPWSAALTVMCYNVLCDKYATQQMYGYCPSWALSWEYRKKGIVEEITAGDADIISLQVKLVIYIFFYAA